MRLARPGGAPPLLASPFAELALPSRDSDPCRPANTFAQGRFPRELRPSISKRKGEAAARRMKPRTTSASAGLEESATCRPAFTASESLCGGGHVMSLHYLALVLRESMAFPLFQAFGENQSLQIDKHRCIRHFSPTWERARPLSRVQQRGDPWLRAQMCSHHQAAAVGRSAAAHSVSAALRKLRALRRRCAARIDVGRYRLNSPRSRRLRRRRPDRLGRHCAGRHGAACRLSTCVIIARNAGSLRAPRRPATPRDP